MADEQVVISGRASLTFRDHLFWAFSSPKKLLKDILLGTVLFVTVAAGVVVIFSARISVGYFLQLAIMGVALVTAINVLVLLFMPVWSSLRLSSEQKAVEWQITQTSLCLSDDAGNRLETPWSQVRHFYSRRQGFLLIQAPNLRRFIPSRTFSEQEREQVIEIAISKGVYRS